MAKGLSIHIGLNRVDPAHYRDNDGQPWDGKLVACESDARDMQAIAKAQGFETELLLSEQATSQTVIDAIGRAAQQLGPDDILLVTYSGHGGQVPDRNDEEEPDRFDETWCLYDRQLVDDELYALWGQFAPGTRIMMVSDSCHSGTVAKDPDQSDVDARVAPLGVQVGTYKANQTFYDDLQGRYAPAKSADVRASVILISGCQDSQLSYDGWDNGQFTGKLRQVWGNGAFQGSTVDFHGQIVSRMPAYQTPNLFKTGVLDPDFEKQRPFSI